MSQLHLRQRQIHLDFHTGPAIPDVGADFDARAFARAMKAAHVNSVTVFAKCHHGHLYYNTNRPERHPGLRKGFDLLRRQVDALHHEGIRAPIYISVQCDEYAANTHPDWVARNADSSQVKWGKDVFLPGWQILDMSSPYQDFVAEQTEEILQKFKPVDGVFFDMCWDQASTTKWALAGMKRAGLNPREEADRATYSHQVSLAYMDRFFKLVKRTSRDATIYFNGRQHSNLHEEHRFQTQAEIEALPTGGWGYLYFPKNVRFARKFPLPTLGMTARFHKSWADFGGLKPEAALKYEVSQMLAHGAACSVGDQLHPRGTLDKAAYELIGAVYEYAAACEPWTERAQPVTQVGLLRGDKAYHDTPGSAIDGATRMLMQLKLQFDVVNPGVDLDGYELLITADDVAFDAAATAKLRAWLKRGGRLLVTGAKLPAWPELGIKALGDSPYTATYIRFGKELGADAPDTNHIMYERGLRVKPTAGAQALAQVVEPYFERAWDHFCSHAQTPNQVRPSPYAAAVRKGNVIAIPYPIFKAYGTHGNLAYRLLVRNCLALLLPQPLIEVTGPSTMEVTVTRQGKRTIVHFLNFVAERRTPTLDIVEESTPVYNIPLRLRLAKRPRQAYLAPSGEKVSFDYAEGVFETIVTEVNGHQMLVLE